MVSLDISFRGPAVRSCQVGLSSVVGLIRRKTNSRFPRLFVAGGRVCVCVCVVWAAVFALPRSCFLLHSLLSLLSYHFPLSSYHLRGACGAVMLSDSLPALLTSHTHAYAWPCPRWPSLCPDSRVSRAYRDQIQLN